MNGVCPSGEMKGLNAEERLSDVRPGESAQIIKMCGEGGIARRLTELGLIPDCRIECLFRSPSGDPTAYRIRGAVIALRKADTDFIRVMRGDRDVGL